MIEIERKFLVLSDAYKNDAYRTESLTQGFLNTHKSRTVRVRVIGDQGFLTVKGDSSEDGTSRFEWEKEIDVHDAETLLGLCEEHLIRKTRYEVKVGDHVFEIDEFQEDNLGLVVAEVELNDVDEPFIRPSWLGQEVTGDIKYYNSQLSKYPYKTWKK